LPPHLDPRGSRSARGSRSGRSARRAAERRRQASQATLHGALIGVKVLAAVLSLAVVLGSGWAWTSYRSFNDHIKRLVIPDNPHAPDIDGKAQNILIVGNDDRDTASDAELAKLGTTRDGGSYNTDTMMLLHVPADGSKATVISFPRDSYVSIPGHGKAKLNSAYPDGMNDSHGDKAKAASLLEATIDELTGLKIDHFVQVDLLGFYRISNAIGGVPVCLVQGARPAKYSGETADGIDSGYEPDGTFVKSYTGIDIKPGVVTKIQGLQALAFVRQRHGLKHGDIDRIKRQQYFLSAVFRKLVSAGTLINPIKLQNLLNAITKSLTMDDSLDPLKLAKQMQNLSAGNVTFTTIPTLGDQKVAGVGDVVVVNTAAMPAFIDRLIGKSGSSSSSDQYGKAKAADPSTVTVAVVNDTNSNGLEKTNAAALNKLGFQTTIPAATSDVVDRTVIEYPKGQESAAKAVAGAVPGAAVSESSKVSGVTLVLGNNGVQVKSLMPSGSSGSSPSSTSRSSSGSPSSSGSDGTGSSDGTVTTTAAQGGCIY
jgi:LCP family protein required for cell wall assembly